MAIAVPRKHRRTLDAGPMDTDITENEARGKLHATSSDIKCRGLRGLECVRVS